MPEAPAFIRHSNPLTRRLLRLGLPMGPNVLLTVRGRTSGLPRSAPVAVAEIDGRRWVIGVYGDVQWVRNLRAAGEGQILLHGRYVPVRAHALTREEALVFYRDTLPGYVATLPWFGRAFVRLLFRLAAPAVTGDPARAAATRPVFELRLAEGSQTP
ncbi:MAG TPA: nitroreductase family deazaflavin-dependent oxidoreductase [Candidatus Limnocylindria bacterium]|nr:nitroreductase family deazaflavin-dependent oxidoreductase [Candidatus Limnocylindria bacterium]